MPAADEPTNNKLRESPANQSGWIRVPIGAGAGPYVTVQFERTILVVARTLTTTVWLLEFLEDVVGDDPRIQVLFTVEDDAPSVYHEGARELLKQIGARVVPWEQACATSFDLIISSTQNGSLALLHGPLFITPHGPGFGKPASIRPNGAIPVARDMSGRPLDTTVVVSHPDDAQTLEPLEDHVHVLVAGDPAYDRIRASHIQRAHYRHAFGVAPSQRLIILTSTWGPGAQFGKVPELAARVRAEVPLDEAGVALVIHPNIWFGHGPWQVRTWLRRAREAGVILVAPQGDQWRAAIVASDIVVMDHGSVGFYAAAIGRPVMRASFNAEFLRADAPLAELAVLAPSLDFGRSLREQLWEAVESHDPSHYGTAIRRMFPTGIDSVGVMRRCIYERLELVTLDATPATRAISVPQKESPAPVSQLVFAATSAQGAALSIERYPATLVSSQYGGFGDPSSAFAPFGGGGGYMLRCRTPNPAPLSSRVRPSSSAITGQRTGRITTGGRERRWRASQGAASPQASRDSPGASLSPDAVVAAGRRPGTRRAVPQKLRMSHCSRHSYTCSMSFLTFPGWTANWR